MWCGGCTLGETVRDAVLEDVTVEEVDGSVPGEMEDEGVPVELDEAVPVLEGVPVPVLVAELVGSAV